MDILAVLLAGFFSVLLALSMLVAVCALQRPWVRDGTYLPPRPLSRPEAALLGRLPVAMGLLLGVLLFFTQNVQPAGTPRVVHRCAIILLGVFLVVALYLQTRAVVACVRGESTLKLLAIYERLWRWTEAAPAPAALLLLASGMRLTSQYGHSLREGWLLVLVVAFGFLFFDGILGFTPLVRDLHRRARRGLEAGDGGDLRERTLALSTNVTLLAHVASLPFLVLVGWFRPAIPNPLGGMFVRLEAGVANLTGVASLGPQSALVVTLGSIGAAVGAFRWLTHRRAGS